MFQTQSKLLTFDQFVLNYGNDSRYELIDGELIDVEPTGPHEQVAAFGGRKLNGLIDGDDRPYFIPYRCLIKPLGTNVAFRPDVIVLDQTQLVHEPLWQQEPIITLGASIKVVVEVVSQNWQNDYARKVEDYAVLGIPEYWIVDYLGIGDREYIGKPKQPTLTICTLVEDAYEKRLFKRVERLVSPTFPGLQLTAEQVFRASHVKPVIEN